MKSRYITGALDFVWGLAVLSAVILAVLLAWSVIADLPAPTTFGLEVSPTGFSLLPSGSLVLALPVALDATGDAPMIPEVHGNYRFPVQKGEFLTISLAILLIQMLLAVAILEQLRQVFRTLQNKDPFRAENVTRIRRIAWAVIAMEVIEALATAYWSAGANSSGFRPASHIGVPGILYGLLILALAEVFREGARLREEQSLTI